MREVIWSDQARDEFFAILRHIARDNPIAAGRVADRIDSAASHLAEMPTGRPGRVSGTYEKVVSRLPYIIACEIGGRPEGGEAGAVLHVIHGARDWPDGGWPSSSAGVDRDG